MIRTTTPVLFAVGSGIQCSALGTTFWGKYPHKFCITAADSMIATRTAVLNAWNTGDLGTSDRRKASAIAGAISGGTVGALAREDSS